ncbi:ribonuclease H [Acrasis kona]|uniref:Ribonuclease H n=1 Tax=Acrasis kona TaxID=1008807 RepID=A0AAW2YXT3_9EUKA
MPFKTCKLLNQNSTRSLYTVITSHETYDAKTWLSQIDSGYYITEFLQQKTYPPRKKSKKRILRQISQEKLYKIREKPYEKILRNAINESQIAENNQVLAEIYENKKFIVEAVHTKCTPIDSLNTTLLVWAIYEHFKKARIIYEHAILQERLIPNITTFRTLLRAATTSPKNRRELSQSWSYVLDQMKRINMKPDMVMVTMIVRAYRILKDTTTANTLMSTYNPKNYKLSYFNVEIPEVQIYTDASLKGNLASYAFLSSNCIDVVKYGLIDANVTKSDEAELYAVIVALEDVHRDQDVVIFTDSANVIGLFAKCRNSNIDQLEQIHITRRTSALEKALLARFIVQMKRIQGRVRVQHVKGHGDDAFNNMADFLCRREILRRTRSMVKKKEGRRQNRNLEKDMVLSPGLINDIRLQQNYHI